MKISETISNLKKVNEMLAVEKEYSTALIDCARQLLDQDDVHTIKQLSLEAGAAIATIEGNYAEFGRIGVSSKKFAVQKA